MGVWGRGCCLISLNRWSYGWEQVRRRWFWWSLSSWFFTDHDSDQPIYAVEPCYSTSHNRFLFPHRHWCFSVTDLRFCSIRLAAQAAGLGVFCFQAFHKSPIVPRIKWAHYAKLAEGLRRGMDRIGMERFYSSLQCLMGCIMRLD